MDRLRDTVTDFVYTLVQEQRSMTGEFKKTDAQDYADMLMDSISVIARGHTAIDEKALFHISDIGAALATRVPKIPSYPALVILALEEYMLRQGVNPNFTLVQK